MATFGFSVGDFIAFLGLVKVLTNALRESTGSASEYRALIQTLEDLKLALTTSELVYLQWESVPATGDYRKDGQEIVNAMQTHRQKCKRSIEDFMVSTSSYGNAFLHSPKNKWRSATKSFKKMSWILQKDRVLKLEKELQAHLTALRFYSDSLAQSQIGSTTQLLISNMERVNLAIAQVQSDTSIISSALQEREYSLNRNLGYPWEESSAFAQSVLLLDAIGREIPLPLLFLSSPNVFHDVLFIMYRDIPGSRKILRKEYALTDEDEEAVTINEENWATIIRPGMRLSVNMILQASSSSSMNHCPSCSETTLGHTLPGRRIRCHKCHLTFRIFEHERLVEEVEANRETKELLETKTQGNNLRGGPDKNKDIQAIAQRTQGEVRGLHNRKIDMREELYFKRIHLHLEVPKCMLARDTNAQNKIAAGPGKNTWRTKLLDLQELPPLHQAVAYNEVEKIEKLLTEGASIDQCLSLEGSLVSDDDLGKEFSHCTPLHLASWFGHVKTIKLLLDNGANMNQRSAINHQALNFAVLGHDPGVATLLLRRGANVDNRDVWNQTPLHDACEMMNTSLVHILLEYGADVGAEDWEGNTCLEFACGKGNVKVVKILLSYDANVLHQNKRGLTPLHSAALGGHDSIARILLDQGAHHSTQNKDGETPLHVAAFEGHDSVIRILLDHGANHSTQNKDGETPLHVAAVEGYDSIIKLLLEYGADISAQSIYNLNALHFASRHGQESTVRILLNSGAKAEVRDSGGCTPLCHACQEGHSAIVNELVIAYKDSINEQADDGHSPLHTACEFGHLAVVEILLKQGADARILDKFKRSAFHVACEYGHEPIVNMLAAHGAESSTLDMEGWSPLTFASFNGHHSVVKTLLAQREDELHISDAEQYTPLHAAASGGHQEIVRDLLAHGANIKAKDEHGCTPLHCAAEEGFADVIRILLEIGAELEARNNEYETPLHRAVRSGDLDAIRYLIEHGASTSHQNERGDTPLHIACYNAKDQIAGTPIHASCSRSQLDTAKLLLDHDRNLANIKSKHGWMPLHEAVYAGYNDIVLHLIRETDADVNSTIACESFAYTPLHFAVLHAHLDVIRTLASNGAHMNVRSGYLGLTPLHLGGNATVTGLLQDLGADPKIPLICGLTNVEWALLCGEQNIAKLYQQENSGEIDMTLDFKDTELMGKLQNLKAECCDLLTKLDKEQSETFGPITEELHNLLDEIQETSAPIENDTKSRVEDIFRAIRDW